MQHRISFPALLVALSVALSGTAAFAIGGGAGSPSPSSNPNFMRAYHASPTVRVATPAVRSPSLLQRGAIRLRAVGRSTLRGTRAGARVGGERGADRGGRAGAWGLGSAGGAVGIVGAEVVSGGAPHTSAGLALMLGAGGAAGAGYAGYVGGRAVGGAIGRTVGGAHGAARGVVRGVRVGRRDVSAARAEATP